jgi:hypothetical protein
MGKQTIIFYSPFISERLKYALDIIFKCILKTECQVVHTIESGYLSENQVVVNYSASKLEGAFQIYPSGLLFEDTIQEQSITSAYFEDLPVIFHNGTGDMPYDVFSAVFYLVSRYEEYFPFDADQYGRFKAEDSLAYKQGFIHLPVVEMWAYQLAKKLGVGLPGNSYCQQVTIDVDNAYKYRNKGFFRQTGSILYCLVSGKFLAVKERLAVLSGKITDPAQTFDYLDKFQRNLKIPIRFFILVRQSLKYGNAISIHKPEYRILLNKIHQKNAVGYHPSFESVDSYKLLNNEYSDLCNVLDSKITCSRQHYLKIRFPDNFRELIKLGIRKEFSIGWSGQLGFRAGISRPYPFFDILKNQQEDLMLVPFVAMDRTLKDYLKLTPDAAIEEVNKLADRVKSVGGQFTTLWHNDSLCDCGEWEGWKRVFEETTKYAEFD